jgi:hypothetical protein
VHAGAASQRGQCVAVLLEREAVREIPSVRARPVRRARIAASNDVTVANEPLIVSSRRNTSYGAKASRASAGLTP